MLALGSVDSKLWSGNRGNCSWLSPSSIQQDPALSQSGPNCAWQPMAEVCSIEKNGVSIHIGLFKSEGIPGQDGLFALLSMCSMFKSAASAIISVNWPDWYSSTDVHRWAVTFLLLLFFLFNYPSFPPFCIERKLMKLQYHLSAELLAKGYDTQLPVYESLNIHSFRYMVELRIIAATGWLKTAVTLSLCHIFAFCSCLQSHIAYVYSLSTSNSTPGHHCREVWALTATGGLLKNGYTEVEPLVGYRCPSSTFALIWFLTIFHVATVNCWLQNLPLIHLNAKYYVQR